MNLGTHRCSQVYFFNFLKIASGLGFSFSSLHFFLKDLSTTAASESATMSTVCSLSSSSASTSLKYSSSRHVIKSASLSFISQRVFNFIFSDEKSNVLHFHFTL